MRIRKEKLTVYPVQERVVPNCKLAKDSSCLSNDLFQKVINGKKITLVEKGNYRKKSVKKKNEDKEKDLTSIYRISNAEGYTGTDPLNFFDYSVLSVCISEILEGNACTTPAVILRGLTGKATRVNGGSHNGVINPNQRAAIINSVTKLMNTIIKIDVSEVNEELGYKGKKWLKSAILPACIESHIVNGQPVQDTIIFDRISPIYEVADQRDQVIRYDTSLLDVPNQNNTPLVITIKNYVILRVMEIIKHKMTPTLTLDDIFKKCRITASHEKTRQAKETIDKFLEHIKEKDVIKSFSWKKCGVKIYGFEFNYK